MAKDTFARPKGAQPETRRFRMKADKRDVIVHGQTQHYKAGFGYTVRPGNDELARLVQRWVEEGVAEWEHGGARPHDQAHNAPTAEKASVTGKVSVK